MQKVMVYTTEPAVQAAKPMKSSKTAKQHSTTMYSVRLSIMRGASRENTKFAFLGNARNNGA